MITGGITTMCLLETSKKQLNRRNLRSHSHFIPMIVLHIAWQKNRANYVLIINQIHSLYIYKRLFNLKHREVGFF